MNTNTRITISIIYFNCIICRTRIIIIRIYKILSINIRTLCNSYIF